MISADETNIQLFYLCVFAPLLTKIHAFLYMSVSNTVLIPFRKITGYVFNKFEEYKLFWGKQASTTEFTPVIHLNNRLTNLQ